MWLLERETRRAMELGVIPTLEQQAAYEAAHFDQARDEGGPRLLTIVGSTAEVAVQGVLTPKPSYMARFYGGGNTTYGEIIEAIAVAEQDKTVKNIVYAIDSPGGSVDGLFVAIAAMQDAKKPSTAIIGGMGASAAYALATQADKVIASNKATRIGSVGVVARFYVDENEVAITSTEAPDKAPDVSTEEGAAVVRQELDGIHDLFVDAISTGLGVSTKDINANFGRGATVLAAEAKKRGMIHTIQGAKVSTLVPRAKSAGSQSAIEETKMDLKEFKALHPDVYAAAVEAGALQERDRVSAHLTMGAASGDMKTALAAVSDGSAMTQNLQAKYMAAGMKRSDITARGDDDKAAAGALDGAEASAEGVKEKEEKAGNNIFALAEALLGLESGGVE